jgi:hypothetical protein
MDAPTSEVVTLRPQPEGGLRSLYGHVVAMGKNNVLSRIVNYQHVTINVGN